MLQYLISDAFKSQYDAIDNIGEDHKIEFTIIMASKFYHKTRDRKSEDRRYFLNKIR